MSWARRFFWAAVFDTDGISVGPERRAALDHRFERLWEENGEGGIPYVPYLRAPWYAWVGRAERGGGIVAAGSCPAVAAAAGRAFALQRRHVEPAPEAPSAFPPTFLYTMSWEDPRADEEVLRLEPGCRLLTLTSGGDNSLTALLSGAAQVVSVDVNPAQSALLELKAAALRSPAGALSYDDVWKLFGEGRHSEAPRLYERSLAPLLSQSARSFWAPRLHYFDPKTRGLYFHGGMGKLVAAIHVGARMLGLGGWLREMADAPTLGAQVRVWEGAWPVRFFSRAPAPLVDLMASALAFVLFNRVVLWFGAGVPCAQYEMIERDDGERLSSLRRARARRRGDADAPQGGQLFLRLLPPRELPQPGGGRVLPRVDDEGGGGAAAVRGRGSREGEGGGEAVPGRCPPLLLALRRRALSGGRAAAPGPRGRARACASSTGSTSGRAPFWTH